MRLRKGWGRSVVFAIVAFLIFAVVAPTSSRAQTSAPKEKTVSGIDNPTPARGGVQVPLIPWNFTARASFDTNNTDAAATSAVTFSWHQPKPVDQTVSGLGVSTKSYSQPEYYVQYANVTNLTKDPSKFNDMCNDRKENSPYGWAIIGNLNRINLADTPYVDGKDEDYTITQTANGARLGADGWLYRLVMRVKAGDPVIFTGYPNNFPPSRPDEYVLSCTKDPLIRGNDTSGDSHNVVVKATLDGNTPDPGATVAAKNSSGVDITSKVFVNVKTTTQTTAKVLFTDVPAGNQLTFTETYNGQTSKPATVTNDADKSVTVNFHSDGKAPDDPVVGDITTTGTPADQLAATNCNQYLGFNVLNGSFNFQLGKYVACQFINAATALIGFVTNWIASFVTTNPWDTIRNQTNGVQNVWKAMLSLVDFIVIGGLLLAAFSNIFHFLPLKLDSYEVKSALPGIIWGIILANISFFAMRLFIETASIATQALAVFVSGYIHVSISGQNGGAYLITQAWDQLGHALINTPTGWWDNKLAGSVLNAGSTTSVSGFFTGTLGVLLQGTSATAGLILGIAMFVLFSIVVIIFFAVLLFLLFIRNYIIVLFFILSPLAFFSLGFPPLKMLWQKWWNFFWKWLLMLPAAFAVLAFDIIILHSRNQALAVNGAGVNQNVFDYFFFNGMSLVLIYFAIRVPFMWGQFFVGGNIMDRWAKAGSKAAQYTHSGAKSGADWIQNRRAANRIIRNPQAFSGITGSKLDERGNRVGMARLAGEGDAAYQARLNGMTAQQKRQALYDDITKAQGNARMRNIFRQPEALAAGWKERLAGWKSNEEKEVKKSIGFNNAGGKDVRQKGWYSRFADDYKEVNDPKEVLGDFFGTADKLISTDIINRSDIRKLLAKGETGLKTEINNPNSPLARAMAAAGLNSDGEDVVKMHRAGNRGQQLIRVQDYRGMTVSDGAGGIRAPRNSAEILENMLPTGPAPAAGAPMPAGSIPRPYADFGDEDETGQTSQPSSDDHKQTSPDSQSTAHNVEEVNQAIDAAGKDAIAQTAIQTIKTFPTAAVSASMEAFKKSEQALRDSLLQQNVAKPQAQAIINALFKNINQGITGIPFSQLLERAGATIDTANTEPFVQAFAEKAKALNRTATIAAEEVAKDIPVQYQVASHIAKAGMAPEQVQVELEKYKHDLSSNSGSIEDLHSKVAGIAGKLDLGASGVGSDQLKAETEQTIKEIEGALTMLQHPEFQAARASGDPAAYQPALDSIKNQAILAQHAAVETAQSFDKARAQFDPRTLVSNPEFMKGIKDQLFTALVESSPAAREQYSSSDAKQQQIEAALDQQAAALVDHYNNAIAENKSESAHASIRDQADGPEVLRNQLMNGVASAVFKPAQ